MNYDILDKFENILCEYTGAPYCVLTDCCTHAIELCMRQKKISSIVSMPKHTYVSALMVLHKLGLSIEFTNESWIYEYRYGNTNIWDSARGLDQNMYRSGQMQCLSFGNTKRLQIGYGGAILLDNHRDYVELKHMAYDGRNLTIKPWQDQLTWKVGYHYNMRLETAAQGIEMLANNQLRPMSTQLVNYPDVSKLNIEV